MDQLRLLLCETKNKHFLWLFFIMDKMLMFIEKWISAFLQKVSLKLSGKSVQNKTKRERERERAKKT